MDESEKFEIDINSLTFGDLCDIEDTIGEASAQTLFGGAPSPKALTACLWIVKRRKDPSFTFEQTKALNVGIVMGVDA